MRRGGTLHPPRPRAPATRQAPPFLPSEGQVFLPSSRDFKDQGFGAVQGLPKKGRSLWKRVETRQTLPWDQQSLGSWGRQTEACKRSEKEPQPRAEAVF